jgi:hypothetical protein
MADLDQKLEVPGGPAFHRAFRLLEAVTKLPEFFGTLLGLLPRISVVDSLPPEPSVEQICPGDDRRNDEQLAPEGQPGGVESLNPGDHRLARLDEQFIAANAQAGRMIDVRPCREKGVQIVVSRGFRRFVLRLGSDFSDQPMVYGPGRPSEVGQDVLIIRECSTPSDHRLDQGDFPGLSALRQPPPEGPDRLA